LTPLISPGTVSQLEREAVRGAFDKAAAEYDRHAVLQHEVEARLLERLDYFDLPARCALDLGCGTGIGCLALQQRLPEALVVGVDWAPAMLGELRVRAAAAKPDAVCADMLSLPFAARAADLVFSSLAVQWSSDLGGLFNEIRRVLRPGGLFLFTTFGPDTLHELRAAWARADGGPHVNRFVDMHDIGDLLLAAGFRDPVMDRENIVLRYSDVLGLMRELKAIGAHNAAAGRNRALTGKGRLRAMLEAYEAYRQEGRYPATFEVVYGTARAPAEGQPVRTLDGEVASFTVESLRAGRGGP